MTSLTALSYAQTVLVVEFAMPRYYPRFEFIGCRPGKVNTILVFLQHLEWFTGRIGLL